jgi:anti-sigma factor RsiW
MQNPLARLRFARVHRWAHRRVSDYHDGEMGAAERLRVEQHARECSECRALLASLETMTSALAELSGPPTKSVSGAVLTEVHERLAADDEQLA